MKEFISFSKDTEVFKWGPIPGRYFYLSEFEDAIFKEYYNFYSGSRWPNTLILFKDKSMVWVNNYEDLKSAGKDTFIQYMVKPVVRNKLREQWQVATEKLSYFQEKLNDLYLNELSDNELHSLCQEFYNLIINFWLPTIPCELGSYCAEKLLEEKLKKHIKDESELSSAMEILTAPEEMFFLQKEEIDLSKTKDIENHIKKYFWIRNSYDVVEELSTEFFIKRKKDLLENLKSLIDERLIGVKNKKRKIIKKYKLSKEIKEIVKALCECAKWQDERKKYILICIYYKELFLKEISRRFNYNVDYLRNCSMRENIQILEKRGVHSLIENRAKYFGFFLDPLKKELDSEEALFSWNIYSGDNKDNI